MNFENENTEYKSVATDGIYKSAIAFANTNGGIIYVGYDDDGNAVGIDDVDNVYTKITNTVRDSISPDITMFTKYTLQDNNTILIEVSEGTAKPYYIKSKGIKPSGVYVRQGASSVQASQEQIRMMIKLSDGDVFESSRSLNQELTFEQARAVFARQNVDFSADKFLALGIQNISDKMYTNLALVVSNQCEHTIKIAVFADASNTVFKAHKEFGGSILKQVDEAYEYLMRCNQNCSEFAGIARIDHWDYPPEAIREALLNAVVHREYALSGSIIININDAFMEFISLGGLVPGLSADDIKSGISQPRNHHMVEIFHCLNYIESYGTGIRRIFSLYETCAKKPEIEITTGTFKMILSNMNQEKADASNGTNAIKKQWQTVIDYLTEHGEMAADELQILLNIKVYTRQGNGRGRSDLCVGARGKQEILFEIVTHGY